jgi:hypothetical protein
VLCHIWPDTIERLTTPSENSATVSSAAAATCSALPARGSDTDSSATAAAAASPVLITAGLASLQTVPCRRAAAAAAAALAAVLDPTVRDCGSSGSEIEDHDDSEYLPGSKGLVASASREPRRVSSAGDSEQRLHDPQAVGVGPGSFRMKCWECQSGCFAMQKNSRRRCREVYGHDGPDWASPEARPLELTVFQV